MKYFLLPRKCWYKFWSYYNQWRQRQRWWGASRLSGLFFVSRLHGFLWNSSWWSGTGAGSWLRSGQEEPASSLWSLLSRCSLVSRRSSYAFLLDKSGDLMYYYLKLWKFVKGYLCYIHELFDMRNVDDSISPQVNFCSYIGFSGASIQLEKSKLTISWKYCISKLIGPIYGKRWTNIIISYKISNVLPIMKWKSTLYKVQKLVLIGLFYWFYWHRLLTSI